MGSRRRVWASCLLVLWAGLLAPVVALAAGAPARPADLELTGRLDRSAHETYLAGIRTRKVMFDVETTDQFDRFLDQRLRPYTDRFHRLVRGHPPHDAFLAIPGLGRHRVVQPDRVTGLAAHPAQTLRHGAAQGTRPVWKSGWHVPDKIGLPHETQG